MNAQTFTEIVQDPSWPQVVLVLGLAAIFAWLVH
jgi:hypothetical protein